MQTEASETNGQGKGPTLAPYVENIWLSLIDESPTNPRKTFTDIEGLADDIKMHGLLQPVLVRPKGKRYELVFGARRFRAVKLAGLKSIPVSIRELDDAKVIEIQIVENSKRADIHPLEEADGYRALHEVHRYAVEEIASKVGKSSAYVYGRIRLCALCKEGRKLFLGGRLSTAVALMVARLPRPELQVEALKELEEEREQRVGYDELGPDQQLSVKTASDIIGGKFHLLLAEAGFDTADAKLTAAGACSVCPKRTGNQVELFSDVKSPDVCTDPKCFNEKREAAWKKASSEAEAKGQRVLTEKETKKALPYGYATSSSEYVDLKEKCFEDTKSRTWEQIIGKKEVPTVLARDERGGVRTLALRTDVTAAVGKTSPKLAKDLKVSTSSLSEAEKKRREKDKLNAEIRRHTIAELVAKAQKAPSSLAFWRAFARGVIRSSWADTHRDVCDRRELEVPKGKQASDVLLIAATKMDAGELVGLTLEIVASRISAFGDGSPLKELCEALKVDQKKHEATVKGEWRAKAKAKKAKR